MRKLVKNEVFGCYLVSSTFVPRKIRVHSIRVAHGWIVVEELTLDLQGVSRNYALFTENWPKSDNCRKKGYLAFISRGTASRPGKVVFVRSANCMGGWLSRNQHSTCDEYRELACFIPENRQIARQNCFWRLFYQVNLPDPNSTTSFVLFGA